MVFRERTYSVLIACAASGITEAVKSLLRPSEFWPVADVRSAGEARRELLQRAYDLVIVNAPLPDEFGTRLAVDTSSSGSSGVLLFVRKDSEDEVYAAVMESGVLVLSKPCSSQLMSQTIRTLCTLRERVRMIEEKQLTIDEKIEEMRTVNHAKWLLIERLGMTEAQAQHHIEKRAMDERLPRRDIAWQIIKTYET